MTITYWVPDSGIYVTRGYDTGIDRGRGLFVKIISKNQED